MLDGHVLIRRQFIEDVVDAVAGEQADDIVLGGEVKARGAGIALAAGAAAQLVVDAAALVAFGAEYVETAQFDNTLAQLDVDAATGHVGGDGDLARLTGMLDDLGFFLVVLGVQDLVRHTAAFEHVAQIFAGLDGYGADQHRLALFVALDDILGGGLELGLLVLEDEVVAIVANHLLVGRNGDYFQLVDMHELIGLGGRRAGHAGQLVIHAEIVLQGDGGERLVLIADVHLLLGLDRLVQSFGVTAPLHDAAGEFVDDQHLAVLDYILDIFLEEGAGAERLHQVVDQLAVF